jgi:hypothetical protein
MPRLPPELTSTPRRDAKDPTTHLGQTANIAKIDELGCGEWTTLYEYQSDQDGSRCSYSALLLPAQVAGALKQPSWDLSIGNGAPGFSQSYDDGVEVTTYDRFGFYGAEPLLHSRDFHGIKPRQFDLSEEFRLFHNLYHDRHNDRYIFVDDRGNETVAAKIIPTRARVLTRLLRQYLAARQIALALFFDHRASADVDVEVAKVTFPSTKVTMMDRCYSFNVGEVTNRAFSRLIGKKIISPPPITESGVWPYETARRGKFAEFIIGVGADGTPIVNSSDPDLLANYFGTNEGAPHYLTPVWFMRNVLAKYYDDPNKFSVEDGYLRCGSLWGIQIDNNLPDHVIVYLGDLGRDLHHDEQAYWRHFNVTPGGAKSSETNFRRSFLAQFADPSAPDLIFKQIYAQLNEAWTERFGWPFFRPLHEADAHILKQFRVPISEGLGEFESQLLFLVKLLIDSLNEVELATACGGALPNEKGISKLKRYLEKQKYPYVDRDINLLRTLQELRSSGTAHAKGGKFDKIQTALGLDRNSPRDVFRDLLSKVNQMLTDLSAHFVLATE